MSQQLEDWLEAALWWPKKTVPRTAQTYRLLLSLMSHSSE